MDTLYRGEWVVSSLLQDRAEKFPDFLAISSSTEDLTYGDLRDRAERVAATLVELGVEPGDRVATMLEPCVEYLAAWFGVCWSGGVDVPVNTDYKGLWLEHLLRESGAKILVIDNRWVDRLQSLHVPELQHIIVVGNLDKSESHGIPVLGFSEALGHEPLSQPIHRKETDLAYIIYTSGTTGPSKGVMLSNRGALWNARAWIDILQITNEDVAYSMFPLFHVMARSAVVTSSVWARARVVLRDRFSVRNFWDDIRRSGATFFGYMGVIIHLLYAEEPKPEDANNPVRFAFGAAAPPQIAEAFERRFGLKLIEVYGSTELGVASAPPVEGGKRGTMGKPCDHLVIEIHNGDDESVPWGEEGEIVARPAKPQAMFTGYWKRSEDTLRAFRNLWFHTGDGGKFTEDGYLVFSDRIKDALRRRGENISSFEVERAIQAHSKVLECAAYAVPSKFTEDEVMIAVVPKPNQVIDPEELFRFCVENIPRFALPRYLRIVRELPKTPSQRTQKYKLREEGITSDSFDREALGILAPRR